jgi:hypothetical protein
MSEAKHTPGPWELEAFKVDGMLLFQITAPNGSGPGGNLILDDASIEGETDEEQIANARLIAAAPELLEALKRMDHTLTAHGHVDSGTGLHSLIIAAIAKAEGR